MCFPSKCNFIWKVWTRMVLVFLFYLPWVWGGWENKIACKSKKLFNSVLWSWADEKRIWVRLNPPAFWGGAVCLGRGISKSSVVTASNLCTSGLHLCTLTACRVKNISVRENERSEVSMRKNKGCGLKKESVMCCRWGQSLKKRGREDRRVNYSYLWSKKHYYVLVVSHSSHHFLAVALPLGRPLASFLILFLWTSFCQLVVKASRAPWLSPLQRSSKGRRGVT